MVFFISDIIDLFTFFDSDREKGKAIMARLEQMDKIQPHWWSKTIIAVLMGLTLSYGIVAMFAWFGPGGISAPMKVQLNMWLISAIWLPILALIYLFKTAKSAFVSMLLINALVYLLFTGLWWIQ